jgi:hypothetical protein
MKNTWSNANTSHGAERGHATSVGAGAATYRAERQGSRMVGGANTSRDQGKQLQASFTCEKGVDRDSIRPLFVKLSDPDDSGGVGRGVSGSG